MDLEEKKKVDTWTEAFLVDLPPRYEIGTHYKSANRQRRIFPYHFAILPAFCFLLTFFMNGMWVWVLILCAICIVSLSYIARDCIKQAEEDELFKNHYMTYGDKIRGIPILPPRG